MLSQAPDEKAGSDGGIVVVDVLVAPGTGKDIGGAVETVDEGSGRSLLAPPGKPMSVVLLCRLPLLPAAAVARLNMFGILPRLRLPGLLPSEGWYDWYVSYSARSELKARRYSAGVWELRSRTCGREKPRRR